MVSRAHRFLRGRTPSTAEPVWHLTGNTDDIFFHDAYLGCLSLTDTIRHWTLEQDPKALVVVLTAEGELISEANALTNLLHSRREPRVPQRIHANASESIPVSHPFDRTAESAAEDLSSRTENRRYADQLALLSSIFTRSHSRSIIAIVFGLPEQFERIASEKEESFELRKTVRALVQHAQENIGSFLFLVDPRTELNAHLLQSHSSITIDIPTPTPEEIEFALARVSLRHDITIRHTKSIASHLATNGNLQSSLRRIASLARGARSIGMDTLLHLPDPDEVRITSIFQELDSLVGLKDIKSYFHGLPNIARRRRIELRKHGRLPENTMHMVFKGSAGTGKTSVARIVARLFHALGILPTGAVTEILPTELASKHANEATERMQNSLMKGRGGVIFIDEAHQLMGNPHSEESIKALVTFAENHRNDTVIILAGYTELIDALMRVDEGLKCRFPTSLIFHDYNSEELCQVVHDMARADGFTMSKDTRAPLMRLLEDRSLDAGFGNAGGARNIWQQIRSTHDSRHSTTALNVIEIADIPATITIDDARIAQAEKALAGYIGSNDLHEFMEAQRILLARYRHSNQPRPWVDGMYFVGPPGTGKTSIARDVIAPYLYGIGLLDRPTAKLVTVDDLQTDYDSRAAERVKELFHAARGGVLVIEKVGGLPADNIYGTEVIRALATEAANPENRRTLTILEGREEEIDGLISRYPGLESRFNEKIVFESMSAKSLLKIIRICAQVEGCRLSEDFEQRLLTVAPIAREVAGRNFGNARWAVTMYNQAKENMILRTSSPPESASTVDNTCLIGQDLVAALRNEDPRLSRLLGPAPSASPKTAPPAPLGSMTNSECATRLRNAILPIVVVRDDYQDIGTGFLIAASGLVATAAHVLQDAVRVTIGLGNVEAKIIAVDEETDTALLHLPAEAVSKYEPLPLGQSRDVCAPSELLAAGYQNWEPGEAPYIVQVQVSRNMRDKSSFEVGGDLDRGASGGPLIDPSQGAVIGLVSRGVGSTIKVVTRIEQLRRLLEEQGHGNEQHEYGLVGTDPEQGVQ